MVVARICFGYQNERKKRQQQIAHTIWHGMALYGMAQHDTDISICAPVRARAHTHTHTQRHPQKDQLPNNAHVLFGDSIIWHDE